MATALTPTAHELEDLSAACNKLWDLDSNRLVYGRDYELDLQCCRRFNDGDVASKPLFKRVDESIFQKPTFKTFLSLMDNYDPFTGDAEVVTPEEIKEDNQFLAAIAETQPIKYLAAYLKAKRILPPSGDIRQLLYNLWFKMYKRDRGARGADSSAFEHVFVGEVSKDYKSGELIVKGFHNWIHIYQQEDMDKGKLNYRGYKKPKFRGLNSLKHELEEEQVLSFQFDWEGYIKPIGTSFIGVSPEFEIALYTLCFLCGRFEDNDGQSSRTPAQLGPYRVDVICHKFQQFMGAGYVEESSLTPDQAATKIQAVHRSRAEYRRAP